MKNRAISMKKADVVFLEGNLGDVAVQQTHGNSPFSLGAPLSSFTKSVTCSEAAKISRTY